MGDIRSMHTVLYADNTHFDRIIRSSADGPLLNCRCHGFMMDVVVQRPEGASLRALDGKCVRCRYRLAWIVIEVIQPNGLAFILSRCSRKSRDLTHPTP